MKKAFIFFTILFVSLTVSGQTNSSAVNDFISKIQKLESGIQESFAKKDNKQIELLLKEMLALTDSLKLSEEETTQFQPLISQIKAGTYYNFACVYSLENKKTQAVAAFENAVKLGYDNYNHAKTDSDLDNIRKEKKFIALMDEIRKFDKLYILQNAGNYQKGDVDSSFKFTYQSADNNNLQQVRQYFNLDSVAGNGDEISKIINIMLFATRSIKYDGSNWALCEFSSIDFYNYHKATGKGINCRHKAITLNEMYLAMGFKSRYVTCMPEWQDDPDCHVINCVYSETLKKWLWMDPSHGIYVTDENDNMLSISEVRERLINEKPLKLNKETQATKEWYLDYYMAKNLYWFSCVNTSKFNVESRYRAQDSGVQYINLLPVGYGEGNKYVKEQNVNTHDPDYFWQLP